MKTFSLLINDQLVRTVNALTIRQALEQVPVLNHAGNIDVYDHDFYYIHASIDGVEYELMEYDMLDDSVYKDVEKLYNDDSNPFFMK
jgi:hypothetical protein